MSQVLLVDPVLGDPAWHLLRAALAERGISTTIFEPVPVHSYDQDVEAAALYEQLGRLDTGDTDLALAVGGACGPAVHAFTDHGWFARTGLVMLDPNIGPLVKKLPDLKKFLLANPGSSTASVASAARASGRLALAVAKRLPQFASGRSVDATEGLFRDLASNDQQRRWTTAMAEATRRKEPIDSDLHDSSGLGSRVLDWYQPWLNGGDDVQVWFRKSTGLARFAEEQPTRQGRFRLIDAPSAAWINTPEVLAAQIEASLS